MLVPRRTAAYCPRAPASAPLSVKRGSAACRTQGRAHAEELATANAQLTLLRHQNSAAEVAKQRRAKASLKTDLKRSMGLVKRIKNLTEESVEPLAKEIESINLSRYASEVAVAIVDDRLKSTDVPGAVLLASRMHQRYADFRVTLMMSVFGGLAASLEAVGLCAPRKDDSRGRPGKAPSRKAGARSGPLSLGDAIAAARARVAAEVVEADDDDLLGGSVKGTAAAAAHTVAGGGTGGEESKNAGTRCRTLLRLLWELFRAGVYDDVDGMQACPRPLPRAHTRDCSHA